MKRTPLYVGPPRLAIEDEPRLDRSSLPLLRAGDARAGDSRACTRCSLSTGVRTCCIAAAGEPGGLLVIGDSPARVDDERGIPFLGQTGAYVRELIGKLWKGPVAYDHAVRCAPGRTEVTDTMIKACRGYLADVVREVQPSRIVTLGGHATYAVLGARVLAMTSRRAYRYGFDLGDDPVPVFPLLHPGHATRNRFIRAWFEADLRWALEATPPGAPVLAEVFQVETAADAEEAVCVLSASEWAAFDVETAAKMWTPAFRLLSLAAATREDRRCFYWSTAALARRELREPLQRWLGDARAKKIGSNVKYDINAVQAAWGTRVRGVVGDVRLWRKMLDTEADGKLAKMAELVGMGGMKEEADHASAPYVARLKAGLNAAKLLKKRALEPDRSWPKLSAKNNDGIAAFEELNRRDPALVSYIRQGHEVDSWRFAVVPPDVLARYNSRDSVATARVGVLLEEAFKTEPDITRVKEAIVDRVASRIARVEEWGIGVAEPPMHAFDGELAKLQTAAELMLAKHAPAGFNPGSAPQVRELLFTTLKIKSIKKTKKGELDSTEAAVLDILAAKYPVAKAIKDWRHATHLRGTYGVSLLDHVRADGRIHPSVLADGAGTGRTSMREPNLQNQPSEKRDPVLGKLARDCFVVGPRRRFVSLDYSQIELRCAAAISQDDEMIEIFRSGVDFHLRTAQLIAKITWGLEPDQVGKQHRAIAKNINFAALYNAGVRKIAEMANCSVDEAARAQDAILGRFRRFASWRDGSVTSARKTGYSRTWWDGKPGRRRALYKIGEQDDTVRAHAENGACNAPIQGMASDFLMASLCSAVDWIDDEGLDGDVMLVLPVHDQLLFDVEEALVDRTIGEVREIMCSWNAGGVPLVADAEVGVAWGSLEPVKEAA